MWEINRALKELEADGLHPLLARGVFLPDGCRGMRRKGLVWMKYTTSEVLQFIKENDVKFIRLAFCDLLGVQKNVSIMAEELPRAFSAGISFDASAIAGFMHPDRSDLLLVPDPSTMAILPWRPQHGRVVRFFCTIVEPDGSPFAGDCRALLKTMVERVKKTGYACQFGTEAEFYLFETDENGNSTRIPHDRAGYCDIAPLDKGENVRRQICLTLEEMGIQPESSHHEQGPGQHEVDFKYSDPLTAADNFMTFKSVVQTAAAGSGLSATFLPKPLPEHSGNGMHINLSLLKNGLNVGKNGRQENSREMEGFLAGILNRIEECTCFLNPMENSYERLGKLSAPRYISWGEQNRSQLIRIPAAKGEYSRIEVRSPDPSCNPYIAFTLLMAAGLEGLEQKRKLEAPCCENLYDAPESVLKGLKKLPENREEAVETARNSEFIQSVLPEKIRQMYFLPQRPETPGI